MDEATTTRDRAPLALWCTPRTVSTAFDKMMRARGDHYVFTEPFSVAWYFGPEQRSARFAVTEPEATFDAVLADVLAQSRAGAVFVKDMAYHLGPLLRADALARFHNAFLIRDPAWAVPSLLRRWPDATVDELGYDAQLHAFRLCTELQGRPPPVIDSDALRTDPDGVVGRWCAAVGIEHRPDALSWAPGHEPGWERWADWFDLAADSTGFAPPPRGDPEIPPRARVLVDRCRDAYTELAAHAR